MAVWTSKVVGDHPRGRTQPALVGRVLDKDVHGAEVCEQDYHRLVAHARAVADAKLYDKDAQDVGIVLEDGRRATMVFGNKPEQVVILADEGKAPAAKEKASKKKEK